MAITAIFIKEMIRQTTEFDMKEEFKYGAFGGLYSQRSTIVANRFDIVRHPKKKGEDEGMYLGWDAEITEEGVWEAWTVINRFEELPHDLIVTSPIPRALKLAKMYGERLGVPVQVLPLLKEIAKPTFLVGLHRKDPIHVEVTQAIRDAFNEDRVPMLTEELQERIYKQTGVTPPVELQVESKAQLESNAQEMFSLLEDIRRPDGLPAESVLGVGHAKRIASYVQYRMIGTLEGFYAHGDRTIRVDHTSISSFVREPDRRTPEMIWKIDAVNDTAHVERAKSEQMRRLLAQAGQVGP